MVEDSCCCLQGVEKGVEGKRGRFDPSLPLHDGAGDGTSPLLTDVGSGHDRAGEVTAPLLRVLGLSHDGAGDGTTPLLSRLRLGHCEWVCELCW